MTEEYRITVNCHLDDHWSKRFEGFQVERHDDGTTVLMGSLADQTALQGLIARIAHLNIPLVSIDKMNDQGRTER